MKKYTVGFLFTPDLSQVLLIHKLAPEWQKGKLNGLGGKMEMGESAKKCFIREIEEESDIKLDVKKKLRKLVYLKVVNGEFMFLPQFLKEQLLSQKLLKRSNWSGLK